MLKEQTEHDVQGIGSEYRRVIFKLQPAAFNLIQLVLEDILIKVIKYAAYIVRETTKGAKADASPRRTIVTRRDINTACAVLRECYPILQSGPRVVIPKTKLTPAAKSVALRRVAPPRGKSASAKAKAKSKGKAKAKAKSKSKAKAKPASKRRSRH
jgi:hypothetical protein